MLIDSGIKPEALSLKKQMKYLKLDWRSIQVILATAGSNPRSRKRPGGRENLRHHHTD
jgi:hypothetical protein